MAAGCHDVARRSSRSSLGKLCQQLGGRERRDGGSGITGRIARDKPIHLGFHGTGQLKIVLEVASRQGPRTLEGSPLFRNDA